MPSTRRRSRPLRCWPGLGWSAASMQSAACCKRKGTSALAGLKMAVRTSTSNGWTATPLGFPRLEAGHQLLNFLVLGQEEFWRRVFFFGPASLSARVFSTSSCAYCCANSWKRW